jgi:hypothetical protein
LKRVVSVSLGSSKRDHQVNVKILGEEFEISRRGTDGDFGKAVALLKELDGKVDAIGLGGLDVYLYVGEKRYAIEDGLRLMQAVTRTPVVDGSGLKNTMEREAVRYLARETEYLRPGTKALVVSAVDRFGMAEALAEVGCDVVFGDLIFAAGIPYPIRTVKELEEIAAKLLPQWTKLPIHYLYPTGKKQDDQDVEKAKKFAPYYAEAQVIAGDFHLIRRFLPEHLSGQLILTNTITTSDVDVLKERGAGCLVTTTPEYEGRSFGTNVIEAVFVVLINKAWEEITPGDYISLLKRINHRPRITPLD